MTTDMIYINDIKIFFFHFVMNFICSGLKYQPNLSVEK